MLHLRLLLLACALTLVLALASATRPTAALQVNGRDQHLVLGPRGVAEKASDREDSDADEDEDEEHRRPPARRPRNVLLVVMDDFRNELNIPGNGAPWLHTPNMASLAARGTTFAMAFTSAPECGPSRNSFLTGRYPQTTGAFNLNTAYRTPWQPRHEWLTWPQYFKDVLGYPTVTTGGKIFHPDPGLPELADVPRSFADAYWENPNPNKQCHNDWLEVVPSDEQAALIESNIFANQTALCPDANETAAFTDLAIASAAASRLLQVGANASAQPFFMAVGFVATHTSLHVRAANYHRHLDSSPHVHGPTGVVAQLPTGAGAVTEHISWPQCPNEWVSDPGAGTLNTTNAQGERNLVPLAWTRASYWSAVELDDEALGIVLAALKESGMEDDTLVVLTSDHGYNLGEHARFCKTTLWDTATSVPLIVADPSAPWSHGRSYKGLLDLVDLYATSVGLVTGAPPVSVRGTKPPEGVDQSRVIRNPRFTSARSAAFAALRAPRHFAISQMARCNPVTHNAFFSPSIMPNEDWSNYDRLAAPNPYQILGCNRKAASNITFMGYAVRSKHFRLVSWVPFNGTDLSIPGGARHAVMHPVSEELYDYSGGDRAEPARSVIYNRALQESVSHCRVPDGCDSAAHTAARDSLRRVLLEFLTTV